MLQNCFSIADFAEVFAWQYEKGARVKAINEFVDD
jgi:hypothetical protein